MRATRWPATTTPRTGGFVAFTCLQGAKYWPGLCECIGRPELADDPRFTEHAALLENSDEAAAVARRGVRRRPSTSGARSRTFDGQWAVVQDTSRRPSIPRRWPTGTSRSARRRPARRSSSWPRRSSTTRQPAGPGARRSSTSTATTSSPSSASTGTRSSTSRSAASSRDHHPHPGASPCPSSTPSGSTASVSSSSVARTGMGAAAAELALDAGAEVVAMDYAEITLDGVKAIELNLAEKARSTPPSTRSAGPSNACCSPARVSPTARPASSGSTSSATVPDRPHARRGESLPAGCAIGVHLLRRPARRWRPSLDQLDRAPRHRPTSTRPSRGREQKGRADYFHMKQAVCAYVARGRRSRSSGAASASTRRAPAPPTRRSPRPTRRCGSASAPTPRPRLGIEAATPREAGLPVAVPLQRRRRCDQRQHADHRQRLPQRRRHGRVLRTRHLSPPFCSGRKEVARRRGDENRDGRCVDRVRSGGGPGSAEPTEAVASDSVP